MLKNKNQIKNEKQVPKEPTGNKYRKWKFSKIYFSKHSQQQFLFSTTPTSRQEIPYASQHHISQVWAALCFNVLKLFKWAIKPFSWLSVILCFCCLFYFVFFFIDSCCCSCGCCCLLFCKVVLPQKPKSEQHCCHIWWQKATVVKGSRLTYLVPEVKWLLCSRRLFAVCAKQ